MKTPQTQITPADILADAARLTEPQPTGSDAILNRYARLRITDTTAIDSPVPVIKINGEIISTEGNVTTISGASKSGKSAFSSVLIAGAIAPGDYDGLPGVEVALATGKAVLHFDTEQARHKHQRNLCSILLRAGVDTCPPNLHSYNIRECEPDAYIRITDEIAGAASAVHNGVHLIVIDGGADYIKDVNEPVQSNKMVKAFEDLAIKYRCPVICIVHLNPGSDKERGHFGSQLQRKSESVLSVKTEGDISFLEPKFLRMAGKGNIPHIQFTYDHGKGYHVYCGIQSAGSDGEKNAKRVNEIRSIAGEVFTPPTALAYNEAIEKIMRCTNKAIASAKIIFKEMKAHKMIVQGEDKNWRANMDKGLV